MTNLTDWNKTEIEYKVVDDDDIVITYDLLTNGKNFLWYDSENDEEEVLACGTDGVCCHSVKEAVRRMERQIECLGWEDCGSNWDGQNPRSPIPDQDR